MEAAMNARARMSSKGQIVVPKSVRDELGLTEGTEVEFVRQGRGVFVQPVSAFDPRFPPLPRGEFLKHVVKADRPFPTEAEIEDAMLAEAARRFDADRG
jgi:AbrB family looped-hinge helix DNA binding protein